MTAELNETQTVLCSFRLLDKNRTQFSYFMSLEESNERSKLIIIDKIQIRIAHVNLNV